MKYLFRIIASALLVVNAACNFPSSSPPSPPGTAASPTSTAKTLAGAPAPPTAATLAEDADPPAEPGEQASPTDETSPTTGASPAFPNEEKGLISPEGQKIIDDIKAGRIPKPQIQSDFESFDEKDDVVKDADEKGVAEPVCSAGRMKVIYKASMSKFLDYRKHRDCTPNFKWSTDGCSGMPDTGVAFDFRRPCWRHDFGYRNYKKFHIFTKANKSVIDDKFLSDMKAHCSTRSILLKTSCYETAYIYYWGARRIGT